jgi:hypothetical protein
MPTMEKSGLACLGLLFLKKKEADNTSPVVEDEVSSVSPDSNHHCDARKIKPIGFFTQKILFSNAFQPQNTLQTSLEH